jgi:DNA-binding MarR family transcriptional regulator
MSNQRARAEATAVHEFFRYWFEWVRSPARRRQSELQTGLPQSAAMILHRLQFHGPVSVTALARSFGLDKSTISRQLQPLRAAGLIEETPDETNRRVWHISVSEEGLELCERVATAQIEYWRDVLAHLPADDRVHLVRALGELQQAMETHNATLAAYVDDDT